MKDEGKERKGSRFKGEGAVCVATMPKMRRWRVLMHAQR